MGLCLLLKELCLHGGSLRLGKKERVHIPYQLTTYELSQSGKL